MVAARHSDLRESRRAARGAAPRRNLLRKCSHPVVREYLAQSDPAENGRVGLVSNCHENIRSVNRESLAAHAARTENEEVLLRCSMQADGRQDGLVQSEG